MTERVKNILEILRKKEYREKRVKKHLGDFGKTIEGNTKLTCEYISYEKPVFIEGDRIGFYRYNGEMISAGTGNFTPEYDIYLKNGFDYVLNEMKAGEKSEFSDSAVKIITAIYGICEKYKNEATGELKKALETVPQNPPKTYYEALVLMKIIIFSLRLAGSNHVTLGRFDQYMYPFYLSDLKSGVSKDELFELTEEFFLSLNFDSDIYFGIQQGDNGQSMVLGGLNEDGSESFNELSEMCMLASMELNLIDPKINLRVNKNTPDSLYLLGTKMTKLGLGFPQYSNDDIVIPGLLEWGYEPKDAYNYGVAACWEFIVPDGRDAPNFKTMNFPKVVNDCVFKYLKNCKTYDEFFEYVKKEIKDECERLLNLADTGVFTPNVAESLFSSSCLKKRTDASVGGAKYNNYGFHGAGIANAADALCVIKELIFEQKKHSAEELISALKANFAGFEGLHSELIACPKMGNNDDRVDALASDLMDAFCISLKPMKNKRFGGIIRPGTGSAQGYITEAENVGATADGRYAYTPYSSSFSPAITSHISGPLSVIQSFTKFDLKRITNGGPLTLEIHDNTFRNEEGIKKVAQLVKSFILLGGHQLQLNAINRDKLLDAQKHPENYPNLIVRVWGWSGYFNELDLEYQNHIIKRTEFSV